MRSNQSLMRQKMILCTSTCELTPGLDPEAIHDMPDPENPEPYAHWPAEHRPG